MIPPSSLCINRFVQMAERKVAIFDCKTSDENQCNNNKSAKNADGNTTMNVQMARHLAQQMDDKGADDAFALFNLDTVVERYAQWRVMLPRVQPFYAVKCNNDPVLLRLLADLGCGFDCASRGEIDQVINSGLASGDGIIYANPCKTRAYIRHAKQNGVCRMTFDSIEELLKIREEHSAPELILRIDVADQTAQCPLSTKFGCDPIDVAPRLVQAASEMGIRLVGISFHVGSGCRDPRAFAQAIAAAKHLFLFGLSLGQPMHLLDIGGGFPGYDTEQITFAEIVSVVQKSLDRYFPEHPSIDSHDGNINDSAFLPVKIVAEPGRYFGCATVSLCTNVISVIQVPAKRVIKRDDVEDGVVQQRDGQMLYVNDGVYGSFNCILYDHFHPRGRPLFGNEDEEEMPTIVWGPTCDGLDQIEACTSMRKLRVGDWLFYEHMGAYTSVAASQFNGFNKPQTFYAISDQCWNIVYTVKGNESDDRLDDNNTGKNAINSIRISCDGNGCRDFSNGTDDEH